MKPKMKRKREIMNISSGGRIIQGRIKGGRSKSKSKGKRGKNKNKSFKLPKNYENPLNRVDQFRNLIGLSRAPSKESKRSKRSRKVKDPKDVRDIEKIKKKYKKLKPLNFGVKRRTLVDFSKGRDNSNENCENDENDENGENEENDDQEISGFNSDRDNPRIKVKLPLLKKNIGNGGYSDSFRNKKDNGEIYSYNYNYNSNLNNRISKNRNSSIIEDNPPEKEKDFISELKPPKEEDLEEKIKVENHELAIKQKQNLSNNKEEEEEIETRDSCSNYSKDVQEKLKRFLGSIKTLTTLENSKEEKEENPREKKEKKKTKIKLIWYGNKFEILGKELKLTTIIGKGSFAVVYKGYDKKLDKEVAIKVFQKQKLFSKFKRDLLQKELEYLDRLNNDKIPKLLRVVETKQKVYVVLEFSGEKTLKDLIERYDARKEEIPIKEVKSIMKQLIETIDYIHSEGIYHRDIKLTNVMYNKGKIGVIDFGLATDSRYGMEYLQCGTVAYMPPELLKRKAYNAWSVDVWCLGVVFYWLLKKEAPFAKRGLGENEVRERILKIKVGFKGIGEEEERVLRMIFRRKPDERVNVYQLGGLEYWDD